MPTRDVASSDASAYCLIRWLKRLSRRAHVGISFDVDTSRFARVRPADEPHILNTPNLVSGTGALSAALNAKAKTRRVSPGAMMPSSHSRAVA